MVNKKDLKQRIEELLEREPGISVKAFADRLGLNRIYLSGFLDALELEGRVSSKKIGPARAFFSPKPIDRKGER